MADPVRYVAAAHAFFTSERLAPSRSVYWTEWRGLRCPTLIVRGEHGYFPTEHMQSVARLLPGAAAVTIAEAGHDVHVDAAAAWVYELKRFLAWVESIGCGWRS